MYIDAPAFNIIRSTGKPGQIRVRVRSPGLAPAEVVLTASEPTPGSSVAILQAPIPPGKRHAVAQEGRVNEAAGASLEEFKPVSEDLAFPGPGPEEYARQIGSFLRGKTPVLESDSPELAAVISVFTRQLDDCH